MHLCFPVAFATVIIAAILIVWIYFGTKNKKFTFTEIGETKTDELHKKDDLLCTSPYFSMRNLGIIRLVCTIWLSIVMLVAIIESSDHKSTIPLLAWYTVWNWLILWLYFLLSTILTFVAHYEYKCCFNFMKNNKVINRARIAVYILFTMECGLVLLVDLVVWCLLYPFANQQERKEGLLPFTPLMMHTTNFVLIYFELIINNITLVNYNHAIFSMILPLIYCIFEWFLNIIYGISFAYFFVDPGHPLNTIWYFAIFGVHLLCWTIAYKFQKVVVHKKIRGYVLKTDVNQAELMLEKNLSVNSVDTSTVNMNIQTENINNE